MYRVLCRLDFTKASCANTVTLPVYLNASRGHLLFTLDFYSADTETNQAHRFYERGVAIICSDMG